MFLYGKGGLSNSFHKCFFFCRVFSLVCDLLPAKQAIGIDYGYYHTTLPKNDLYLGNIEINGEDSYGFRLRDYVTATYYNSITVSGNNGTIVLNGRNNIGVAIIQGKNSGDPISMITNLDIEVNGESNVGFFRDKPIANSVNTSDFIISSSTGLI